MITQPLTEAGLNPVFWSAFTCHKISPFFFVELFILIPDPVKKQCSKYMNIFLSSRKVFFQIQADTSSLIFPPSTQQLLFLPNQK